MTREEVAQLLYEAGFRGEDLVSMVAIAGRESGYRAEAHRTNPDPAKMVGDFGLFQINYINDTPAFREAIGMTDRAAAARSRGQRPRRATTSIERAGLKPWTAAEGGWTADGDPLYGTDVAAAREAVERAAASGMIGEPFDVGDATAPAIRATPQANGPSQVELFVKHALAQAGDRYESERADRSERTRTPTRFDCSELVEWAAAQRRRRRPRRGLVLAVQPDEGRRYDDVGRRGAAHPGRPPVHVPRWRAHAGQTSARRATTSRSASATARTIEAMGTEVRASSSLEDAGDRGSTHAALGRRAWTTDPGPCPTSRTPAGARAPPAAAGPVRRWPRRRPDSPSTPTSTCCRTSSRSSTGSTPDDPDTDGDGITDGYELIVLGTDAGPGRQRLRRDRRRAGALARARSDGGRQPRRRRAAGGADRPGRDSDGDGITDWGEELAGTTPTMPTATTTACSTVTS